MATVPAMMLRRHGAQLLARVFAIALAGACAAPPITSTPRPADAPAPVAVDPLSAPWLVSAGPGTISHEIRLESSLIARVDSTEQRDTVRAFVAAEWTRLAGESPARISGLLLEFALAADTLPPVSPVGPLLPLPFAAVEGPSGAQVNFTRPDAAGCGTDAAALQMLRELFVSPPRRLEAGTTWADSAHYSICRDSIVLDVRSVRSFRVTGAERRDGNLVALVERTSRVNMMGEGHQFGETLTITAEGEGTTQLAIRLSGAFIVAGDGEATLRMTMRGRRRSQELTQHTRISIAAR